jgi:hypothetical protein
MVDQDGMNMGIKGPNNEPRRKNKMAHVRKRIVQHDTDDSDINGTFEDTPQNAQRRQAE